MALKDITRIVLACVLLQKTSFWSSNVASAQSRNDIIKDPMVYYTAVELACSEGYPAQEHKIVTEDGYVLTVHRIPNGRTRAKVPRTRNQYHTLHLNYHPDFNDCVRESLNVTSKGLPVLFAHGLLMSSDGWLLQGHGFDLAYILADAGYDVWLVNIRGNFFSRKHVTLSPSDPRFWDFSFHENAVFDMPAVIDHILKVTKKDKIGYVGFSLGTTIFFTMTSVKPEYNDKILGFVGLAPVAYMKEKHMEFRKKTLFNTFLSLLNELKRRGIYELFPKRASVVSAATNACSKGSNFQDICYDFISVFVGYHSKLVLRSKLHLYATHCPTGTSVKTVSHYLRNFKTNAFRQFDYGREKNLQVYGSPVPWDYPVWNITAPTALFYSDGDFYYDVKDLEDLRKVLPNVVEYTIAHNFNHLDYIWSFKGKDILYPKVLNFFNTLSEQYYLQSRRKKSVSR